MQPPKQRCGVILLWKIIFILFLITGAAFIVDLLFMDTFGAAKVSEKTASLWKFLDRPLDTYHADTENILPGRNIRQELELIFTFSAGWNSITESGRQQFDMNRNTLLQYLTNDSLCFYKRKTTRADTVLTVRHNFECFTINFSSNQMGNTRAWFLVVVEKKFGPFSHTKKEAHSEVYQVLYVQEESVPPYGQRRAYGQRSTGSDEVKVSAPTAKVCYNFLFQFTFNNDKTDNEVIQHVTGKCDHSLMSGYSNMVEEFAKSIPLIEMKRIISVNSAMGDHKEDYGFHFIPIIAQGEADIRRKVVPMKRNDTGIHLRRAFPTLEAILTQHATAPTTRNEMRRNGVNSLIFESRKKLNSWPKELQKTMIDINYLNF